MTKKAENVEDRFIGTLRVLLNSPPKPRASKKNEQRLKPKLEIPKKTTEK
jgi:hypothetical protein